MMDLFLLVKAGTLQELQSCQHLVLDIDAFPLYPAVERSGLPGFRVSRRLAISSATRLLQTTS